MNVSESRNRYSVKSSIKALGILEHLGTSESGSTLTEISERVRVGKSTVHRLLGTLRDHEFVWPGAGEGPRMRRVSLNDARDDAAAPRLRSDSLKDKLRARKFVVGTFLEIPSPAVVELLGLAGFDFVVVDCEHGPIDAAGCEQLIRAGASTPVSVLVRVPECAPAALAKPLDWGADGIHVPHVASGDMARLAVDATKYHPLGHRGLQPYVRAASYRSFPTPEYLAAANDATLIVAQVEGAEGIANLESILKVDGIDVAFIGPYDLSQSLGIPAQVRHPRVREAMAEAVKLAARTGRTVGTYCDDVETAIEYRSLGVAYLTVSIDAYIFLAGARNLVSRVKERA